MLSSIQTKVLTAIQAELEHGDVGDLAESTGYSRVYVSNVLSLSSDYFNQDIIDAAADLIAKRKAGYKETLKKLTA